MDPITATLISIEATVVPILMFLAWIPFAIIFFSFVIWFCYIFCFPGYVHMYYLIFKKRNLLREYRTANPHHMDYPTYTPNRRERFAIETAWD